MALAPNELPKIQDLFNDIELAREQDALMVLLNQEPPVKWIKEHPYIKGYRYLPIDKIEFLLKRIFKKYCIEVLREGSSFNGVYVVVRVHYQNPITGQMDFHDGIGATQLQTAKGTSPADLANINNGALAMAYPLAKTVAIKDACDHFGKSFGSDLNRKDTLDYGIDTKLSYSKPPLQFGTGQYDTQYSKILEGTITVEQIKQHYSLTPEVEKALKDATN